MTELSTINTAMPLLHVTQVPDQSVFIRIWFDANSSLIESSLLNAQFNLLLKDPASNLTNRVECLYNNAEFVCKAEEERGIDILAKELQDFYNSSVSFLSESANTVQDFCKVQFQRLNHTYEEYRPYIPIPTKYR